MYFRVKLRHKSLYILYILHYTVYSILYCIFYTILYILYYTVYSIHYCIFYTILYILYYTVYSILYCIFYTILYILYYTVYSILYCIFYTILHILYYTVYSILYCTYSILYCIFYTILYIKSNIKDHKSSKSSICFGTNILSGSILFTFRKSFTFSKTLFDVSACIIASFPGISRPACDKRDL